MAKLLLGKPVADAIYSEIDARGVSASLLLLRVGEDPASVSYENMLVKKAGEHNISVKQLSFAEDVDEDDFLDELDIATQDGEVDGFLILRPLPPQIDVFWLKKMLAPDKDIDCMSESSVAKMYTDKSPKFIPATAQSVLEILDFYDIEAEGKNVVIVGRSDVVGKPLAHLLLNRDATVTVAHSKTSDLPSITKRADVVVLATGRARAYGADYFSAGQVVIDVGTNVDEDGKLTGDVDFKAVEPIVGAITPVPRGVGSVTTSVLLRGVVKAANG